MRVILQKDVPNLGDAGEVKEVAEGYARNFLIPNKYVVVASQGSTKALEHQKRLMAVRTQKRMAAMKELAQKLEALGSLELSVRVGAKNKLFGSVTPMQISQALMEQGFPIEKRKIELADSIKSPGKYNIKVRLAEKVTVGLQLMVTPDAQSMAEMESAKAEKSPVEEPSAQTETNGEEAQAATPES